ncbi:oxygen-independent coproporphyrinogen III oxidase [Maricaulis sp.]|uniref:oxygen-independent coproporphyrinogen III oxidase n=1 Tax=Maricaulis sp. TaxID=1486257 RepID=UPI0025BF8076|nr:oxygen-independent coproporphyrinogen III oxidase [Maricaulis sp.]
MPAARTADAPRFMAKYALESVPRYTSYPPATGFVDTVGLADWTAWMDAQPAAPNLSIYVHIPFCRSMCWYCGCHTTIPNRHDRVARYLEALDTDILRRAALMPGDARVRHVHFGGGSPDMLKPDEFRRIMTRLRTCFDLAPDAEIAVELDPRGVSEPLCHAMAEAGVNRASLGVQDLSEEVQLLIHRIQPRGTIETAVGRLHAAGITAINMDMMYGLPGQTGERIVATAQAIADMRADRVSVFGYAHVPWFKKHQRAIPETRLPGAAERFEQMIMAARTLGELGYEAIGFDHFARPDDPLATAARQGSLRRNFQGYTTDPSDLMLGLGASAISECAQGYVQTEADPVRYAGAVMEGRDMLVRGVSRSHEARATGARLATLLCRFSLPLNGQDRLDPLDDMIADGLVRIEENRLLVTPAGKPYVRNVAARLDPAFRLAADRHSLAV